MLPTTTSLVPLRDEELERCTEPVIARGAGCSFGDAAYLGGGISLSTLDLTAAGPIDAAAATLTCAPGIRMVHLHELVERSGFAFPIYGGTQWATVGGAASSDIHGKNHPADGSFGHHVAALSVWTPAAGPLDCSPAVEPELFAAVVGGMGLAGVIREVTLRLLPRRPAAVRIQARTVHGLDEMLQCFAAAGTDFQVCDWLHLTARRPRGVFWQAAYSQEPCAAPRLGSGVWLPRVRLFNRWTVAALEAMLHRGVHGLSTVGHVRRFNYGGGHELLRNWNRLFGRGGFIEYHFALAADRFAAGFHALLEMACRRSLDLLFGVVKQFGERAGAGLLSFPLPGYGMNFQLPDGDASRRLLVDFTDRLLELGGRVYLAKDSVVLPRQFAAMYPQLDRWRHVVRRHDPGHRLRSDLSRRLEIKPW